MTAHNRLGGLKDPDLFKQQCLIGGEWVGAASGATTAVANPATGEVIGHVPALSREEVRRAIDLAHAAQAGWRAKTGKERAAILHPLAGSRRRAWTAKAPNTASKTIWRSNISASAASTAEHRGTLQWT